VKEIQTTACNWIRQDIQTSLESNYIREYVIILKCAVQRQRGRTVIICAIMFVSLRLSRRLALCVLLKNVWERPCLILSSVDEYLKKRLWNWQKTCCLTKLLAYLASIPVFEAFSLFGGAKIGARATNGIFCEIFAQPKAKNVSKVRKNLWKRLLGNVL